MGIKSALDDFAETRPWAVELVAAGVALVFGVALMPVLIFYTGAATLGRYEGASVGKLYSSLIQGIGESSVASWAVLLGPYGLYLLFKLLRAWWIASSKLA